MKVAIPKERRPGETRVAASPETVKRLVGQGIEIVIETGAGMSAAVTDAMFEANGAKIAPDAASAMADADVVFKVQRPLLKGEGELDELALCRRGAMLIGMLAPYDNEAANTAYAEAGVDAFAMELMPRITRAQTMDVLSSQANVAGYKAVVEAANHFGRGFPMLMTAAGTVPAARVFVMGAGVAGLQAIATARRLGGIVSATDVRPAAKEEVQSLGASFVAVEDEEFQQAQAEGGYAKEMSKAYQEKQAALVLEHLQKQDVIIATALIPGRPAPTLINEDMVKVMKPGSVIVDIAAERGGNCALTEAGKVVTKHNVVIVGLTNWPALVPAGASPLYAKNLFNFLVPQIDAESKLLKVNWEDEVVTGTCLTRDGRIVHPRFASKEEPATAAAAGE